MLRFTVNSTTVPTNPTPGPSLEMRTRSLLNPSHPRPHGDISGYIPPSPVAYPTQYFPPLPWQLIPPPAAALYPSPFYTMPSQSPSLHPSLGHANGNPNLSCCASSGSHQAQDLSVGLGIVSYSDPNPNMKQCSHSKELDGHKLDQRLKQLALGKETEGYRNYTRYVKREDRDSSNKDHPQTPREDVLCSKRLWDTYVKEWRRSLHRWDLVTQDHPYPQQTQQQQNPTESLFNDDSTSSESNFISQSEGPTPQDSPLPKTQSRSGQSHSLPNPLNPSASPFRSQRSLEFSTPSTTPPKNTGVRQMEAIERAISQPSDSSACPKFHTPPFGSVSNTKSSVPLSIHAVPFQPSKTDLSSVSPTFHARAPTPPTFHPSHTPLQIQTPFSGSGRSLLHFKTGPATDFGRASTRMQESDLRLGPHTVHGSGLLHKGSRSLIPKGYNSRTLVFPTENDGKITEKTFVDTFSLTPFPTIDRLSKPFSLSSSLTNHDPTHNLAGDSDGLTITSQYSSSHTDPFSRTFSGPHLFQDNDFLGFGLGMGSSPMSDEDQNLLCREIANCSLLSQSPPIESSPLSFDVGVFPSPISTGWKGKYPSDSTVLSHVMRFIPIEQMNALRLVSTLWYNTSRKNSRNVQRLAELFTKMDFDFLHQQSTEQFDQSFVTKGNTSVKLSSLEMLELTFPSYPQRAIALLLELIECGCELDQLAYSVQGKVVSVVADLHSSHLVNDKNPTWLYSSTLVNESATTLSGGSHHTNKLPQYHRFIFNFFI